MKKMIALAAVALLAAPAAFAQEANDAEKWQGAYVGVKGAYNFGELSGKDKKSKSEDFSINGAGFSFYAGFNTALSEKLILGIESSVGYGFAKKEVGTVAVDTTRVSFKRKLDVDAKARLGFAMDRILPFVSAGVGLSQQELEMEDADSKSTHSKSVLFYSAGIGADYKLTDNIAVRGEYDYRHYSETKFKTIGDDVTATGHDHRISLGAAYSF
ncbi:outer membrane protein [Polycladidibacter hongkongensis]|uniref:outer membrane protein n=1 Tax=Polycladidibacter hongkongensis TaxID=1647556 RepID=UPI00082FAC57|nr:outer membrane beta-barrel protein [Pseudovibrio hongkongensis]